MKLAGIFFICFFIEVSHGFEILSSINNAAKGVTSYYSDSKIASLITTELPELALQAPGQVVNVAKQLASLASTTTDEINTISSHLDLAGKQCMVKATEPIVKTVLGNAFNSLKCVLKKVNEAKDITFDMAQLLMKTVEAFVRAVISIFQCTTTYLMNRSAMLAKVKNAICWSTTTAGFMAREVILGVQITAKGVNAVSLVENLRSDLINCVSSQLDNTYGSISSSMSPCIP